MTDKPEPLVSDLVLGVLQASTEAISTHFSRLFRAASVRDHPEHEYWLTELLENGDRFDLDESISDEEPLSLCYSHGEITRVFFSSIASSLKVMRKAEGRIPRGIDKHIWAQDYDRRLRSLFPRGPSASQHNSEPPAGRELVPRRTRVSSIVREALRRARRTRSTAKASMTIVGPERNLAGVHVPSPFYIAKQILTDPDTPASEVYATAALQIELERWVTEKYGPLDLSHDKITHALELVRNRGETSKPFRGTQTGELHFLCHYLAMQGQLMLFVSWRSGDPTDVRIDSVFASQRSFFERFEHNCEFRLHGEFDQLPSASELLNELQGLPIPLEGASTVFGGGIRFGIGGDIVAAISGPFGAGKTTTCLAIASALAPLGCRTLFFSCEESQGEIEKRLAEAAPEQPLRSTPLFRTLALAELRDPQERSSWFQAYGLRARRTEDAGESGSEPLTDLERLFDSAITTAPIFEPFRNPGEVPAFARPVIIVDGFHQLAREYELDGWHAQSALRKLVDRCRDLDAIFIFTIGKDEPELGRLDYLCDVVIELDRVGVEQPDEQLTRIFRLLKARRQPCRPGSHIFHLTGPKSFRIKPSVSARADIGRTREWLLPSPASRRWLAQGDIELGIQENSQALVYGAGSAGKAGLGLYMLHLRPTPPRGSELRPQGNSQLPGIEPRTLPTRDLQDRLVSARKRFDIPTTLPFYEARTLVLSFLYPSQYFRTLAAKLRRVPRRIPISERYRFQNLPDRAFVDTIALYPGALRSEDLLAKIENRLWAAELKGIPYTGVLVDGIHNVFVQFPKLEADRSFWPQLYSLLRTKGVSVVTTHTQFALKHSEPHGMLFRAEFQDAQRKAGPLLSALVSGADYVFELIAQERAIGTEYQLHCRAALGEDPPNEHLDWDRQAVRINARMRSLL